jgi:hypothetical protein
MAGKKKCEHQEAETYPTYAHVLFLNGSSGPPTHPGVGVGVGVGVGCLSVGLCVLSVGSCVCVVKSAKAGLREQEARRTEIPYAERRPVVQAKRSGEQLLASN